MIRHGHCGDKYKHYIIAVDSYEDKRLEGVLYHASKERGLRFSSLLDLTHCIEAIAKEIDYPGFVTDRRRFKRSRHPGWQERRAPWEEVDGSPRCGKMATFKLTVRYQYYSSWQGFFTWLEQKADYTYSSFAQLVQLWDGILDAEPPQIMESADKDKWAFHSVLGFISCIGCCCTRADGRKWAEQIAADKGEFVGMLLSFCRKGETSEFLIKIMYHRHNTWQGSLWWINGREKVNFRSFQELLMLLETVVGDMDQAFPGDRFHIELIKLSDSGADLRMGGFATDAIQV